MNRMFVYGSLKKGYGNHGFVETSHFVGEAVTEPKFTMISYGFFPACLTDGVTEIKGEVYDVADSVLARMDRLEGVPDFYQRIRVATSLGEAWMYVMKRDTIKNVRAIDPIESGVWKPRTGY
jgi:gamma-glutamylaminecyclotransferase